MSQRDTQLNVASHRRFVLSAVVHALQAAFGGSYDRDPQFVDLKVTTEYPLEAVDYPCIVVSYNNRTVMNAGVGHEEWFPDSAGILRKWHHSRFEGSMDFDILALTTLDRDLLADALTEVIRFGRLDNALLPFFTTLYGDPSSPVALIFNQIMFDADQVTSSGNSASLAQWSPEDLMQYSTTLSSEVHGGYYNVNPIYAWAYITRVSMYPYNSFDEVALDLESDWSNPFQFADESTATGTGKPSGSEG